MYAKIKPKTFVVISRGNRPASSFLGSRQFLLETDLPQGQFSFLQNRPLQEKYTKNTCSTKILSITLHSKSIEMYHLVYISVSSSGMIHLEKDLIFFFF